MALSRHGCFAWLLGATLCGAADRGYLTAVGPGVLRLQAPHLAVVPADWPPLRMHTPQPVDPAAASTNQPPNLVPDNSTTPPANSNPAADAVPDGAPPAPPLSPPPTAEPDPLHPQAWLKYFVPGATNANAPSVLLPVDFTPPQPTAAPSSRATYTVSPRTP